MARDFVHRPIAGTVAPGSRYRWRGPNGPDAPSGGLAAAIGLFTPVGAAAKTALLVVGSTTLNASDAALKRRLDRYYTTTVRDDGAAADTSKNLIVISASPPNRRHQVQGRRKQASWCSRGHVPRHGDDGGRSLGTLSGQTQIKIVNTSQQMRPGSRSTRWSRSMARGRGSAGATRGNRPQGGARGGRCQQPRRDLPLCQWCPPGRRLDRASPPGRLLCRRGQCADPPAGNCSTMPRTMRTAARRR